ncbi:UvrD-helicase domain-containing protein [Roseomonas sp. AR75]|uniref:UvrD-helicase domain-containing protein n=1 Tax=Roseomonas sp. AR75 TaxID=2562311 RepID=UPI001F0DE88B|nr:UvrD-helicase domain-containing protein [Roseomonas sp. AR75]
MSDYLAKLNPEQREAVETLDGPLLVLAGAGTGKTRVLTTRFAHILVSGKARPWEVLAVTFTNKAAREMRERIAHILGRPVEGLWLGTFHALCARMLRRHAELVGLKSGFTILDADDQLRLLKQVMEAERVDLKRWPAQGMMAIIQRWKDRGLTPSRVTPAEDTDYAANRGRALYEAYQARLRALNAADFGDLLLHVVEVLRGHPEVLAEYHRLFRYILVDEYQDTNLVQYYWLRLLAQRPEPLPQNICCVGDDDQCLAAGTLIRMADGSDRPIETVQPGELVQACHGSGDFRPAEVLRSARRRANSRLLRIRLSNGAELVSTPEHMHFADVILGDSPQRFFTYLMHKRGVGWRLGTSQVYTQGQQHPVIGFKLRAVQEHADALWLVDAFETENDARECEHLLSLRHAISTLPFVARQGASAKGLVHDQARLDRIHARPEAEEGARRLMAERGLDPDAPHHVPQGAPGRRRNLTVTFFADRRGTTPMHRIATSGNDEEGRAALAAAGLNARAYRRNPRNWRFETCFRDVGAIEQVVSRLAPHLPVTLVRKANLLGRPLTMRAAAQIRPGMMMAGLDGRHHAVIAVEPVDDVREVFDLDIAGVHNFVANGIVTHNSIYSWRGAEIENILRFEKDFRGARIVRLEANYRSTRPILGAASGLIAKNTGRLGKTLRPGRNDAEGEKVRVVSLWDSEEEARMVGERIESLRRSGHSLNEVAILVRAGFQTRSFEERLIVLGLPYRVVGGLKFYERAEIRDALAYLRVLNQPADDLAFERIVNVPKRGLGDSGLRALHEVARAEAIPLAAAALRVVEGDALKPKPRNAVRELMQGFARWRQVNETEGHIVAATTMLEESGYTAMWQEAMATKKDVEAQGRLENLKELIRAMGEFQSLAGFLDHVALVMENDENAEGERLQIMTLHAAKGLEFDTVFLPGWEEGLFPSQRSLDEGGEKALEEERRLAYVGITRARKHAFISHAANRRIYGNWSPAIPSRFLDELPDEMVQREGASASRGMRDTPSVFGGGGLLARRPRVIEAGAWEVKERPALAASFARGERVFHDKFGYGTVLQVEDDRLEVAFDKADTKRVLDRFLRKASEA